MKLAPEVVSLINAGGLWLFVEFIKLIVRELRRESAEPTEERIIRGYARIIAEEEKRSAERETKTVVPFKPVESPPWTSPR